MSNSLMPPAQGALVPDQLPHPAADAVLLAELQPPGDHATLLLRRGRRPFWFRADPDAPKYHKKLIIVESEAEIIRRTADAVLTAGDDARSVKFIARELRERGVASVTGAAWSAETLRDIMIKPALAGIAVNTRTSTETEGAWPWILEPGVWRAVRAKLTDPARRTNNDNGNAPEPGRSPRHGSYQGNSRRQSRTPARRRNPCKTPLDTTPLLQG